MAEKTYEEIKNSFEEKLLKMVESLSHEELVWALKSTEAPSDIRKRLVNNIAEKLMARDLTNDELLAIALSPSHIGKDAAKKILERNPSNTQLFWLMTNLDLGWEISNAAKQISDNRFFAGTTIREDFEKKEAEKK